MGTRLPRQAERAPALAPAALVALGAVLVVGLGAANAAVSRSQRRGDPRDARHRPRRGSRPSRDDILANAREGAGFPVRCNLSKRLYSFVEQYDAGYLMRGRFAALVRQGLPEQRAEFLIDPWNYPYWIRSRCTKDRSKRRVFVYSFGPNRRRDSTRWELLKDDVGLYLVKDDDER